MADTSKLLILLTDLKSDKKVTNMINDQQIKNTLINQLALDFNCTPEDITSPKITLTVSALNEGRRAYTKEPPFFSMLTTGQNAVITAHPDLHPFLSEFIKDKTGFWLFEQKNLFEIQLELLKYGKRLYNSHHMYLPKAKLMNIKPNFEIKWFEKEDISQFYGDKRFPNAFCETFKPETPDMLAVGAVIDGNIAGMAGCSADSKAMWQIGIDVMPEYHRRGIGKTLVTLLRDEIFKRGAIPFYGTSLSNINSQNVAAACGFYPAWVEIENK